MIVRAGVMLLQMLLRPGVNIQHIIRRLDHEITGAFNYTRDDNAYVAWVHGLERNFTEWFTGVPPTMLLTERFWRINAGQVMRFEETVRQDTQRLSDLLKSIRDSIQAMRARFGDPATPLAILDTHVLLHYVPLGDVQWTTIVAEDSVTLVVPLRVIEEMDEKKFARNRKLADRARTRIRLLEPLIRADSTVTSVRSGVGLTVVGSVDLDPDAQRRPPIPPDVEIMDTCESLAAYAGTNPVYLVTGDRAMRTQARSLGLNVRDMPDSREQPIGADGDG